MYQSTWTLISAVATLMVFVASPAYAHMEMSKPPPRGSKFGPDKANVDYSNTSPTHQICKGKPAGAIVATYSAGSSVDVEIVGGAPHNGGHCQFSLSYDGGKTFVVIQDVMDNCLIASTKYSVSIPATAPSADKAIFAWSWINATGNREYYMNCADIAIKGKQGGSITGPKMLVANILGGPTVPEFPNGGAAIGRKLFAERPKITVNGSGAAASSPDKYETSTPSTPSDADQDDAEDSADDKKSTPSDAGDDTYYESDSTSEESYDSTSGSSKNTSTTQTKSDNKGADSKPTQSTSEDGESAANATTSAPYGNANDYSSEAKTKPPTKNNSNKNGNAADSDDKATVAEPTKPAPVSGGKCKSEGFRCSGGSQFIVCGPAGDVTMNCGAGTVCTQDGSNIRCDYPSGGKTPSTPSTKATNKSTYY
ncbi:hypothetical protein BDF22DRAFT_665440 [Syncephalis plumigaleata]|nr:hypothetical protein BDF22DRAFT_665440 [Syncephalis plumigaleata]